MQVLTEIENRGVDDLCIVVCDGLEGLPEPIEATWPLAVVQTCVLHLIRNTFRLASPVDAIGTRFHERWGERYPAIRNLWSNDGPSSGRPCASACCPRHCDHRPDGHDRFAVIAAGYDQQQLNFRRSVEFACGSSVALVPGLATQIGAPAMAPATRVLSPTVTRPSGNADDRQSRAVPSTGSDVEPSFSPEGRHRLDSDVTVALARLIRPTETEIVSARRKLHLKAAAIGVVAVSSYSMLVFASVGMTLRVLSAVVLVFAVVAIATGVMHDANHGAFSRSKRINRMAGYALDLLGGSSWVWRTKHNTLHHANTNVVGLDTDIDQAPFARMAPQQQRRPWHRHQHIYVWLLYGFMTLRWFLIGDFVALARNRVGTQALSDSGRARHVVGLFAGKAVHLGLAIIVPLALHPWWAVLAFYVAVSWSVGVLLAVVFQLAHCVDRAAFVTSNDHVRGRHFADHQLRTTLDVQCRVPGVRRVVRFMMGGLDFQVEHHLAPGLPHTIYPQLARRVRAECEALGLPYRCHDSLTAALRSHARWLKQMGAPPSSTCRGVRHGLKGSARA